MKKLKQFVKFDSEAFLEDKKLAVKSVKPTFEYINKIKDYANLTGTIFGDYQNQLSLTYSGVGVPFVTVGSKVNG